MTKQRIRIWSLAIMAALLVPLIAGAEGTKDKAYSKIVFYVH
jgi:hypothetical protein